MTNAELLNDLINWDWKVYRDGDCDLVAINGDNRAYVLSSGELIIQKNYDQSGKIVFEPGAKFEEFKFPSRCVKKIGVLVATIQRKVLLQRYQTWVKE